MYLSRQLLTFQYIHVLSVFFLLSDFLPYGPDSSDSILDGDDTTTPNLPCFTSIHFVGQKHKYLTVSYALYFFHSF